mmetsp:Transcript_20159/g.44000  ORF Transcript_20159/g.44000 Transcript_20159/m.44000 type:complete len:246 (-) Transcript_20159:95-832(-)
MVHQNSSLTLLPEQTHEVKALLKDHNARILRKEALNPESGILRVSGHEEDAAAAREPGDGTGESAHDALFAPVAEEEQAPEKVNESEEELLPLAELVNPGEVEPATYRSRFAIYGTEPQINTETGDGLKELCVDNDNITDESPEKKLYQFVLKLRDETNEIDAFVVNDVAESFMSVRASALFKGSSRGRRRHPEYYQGLKDLQALLKEGAMWEGTICTMIIGGEKFFALKSLVNVSDTVGDDTDV